MLDQEHVNNGEAAAQLPRNKDGSIRKTFVKSVARRIEAADGAGLKALVGSLHESDMGALIEALPAGPTAGLVELLGIDFDFTALTEVDDTVREEILEELPSQAVAKGVSELESDDAVAILEDLPKDEQAEILEQLSPPERVALARSLDYPEDSAGRRMQSEFIAVPPHWNVGQAIDYMRETTELPDHFYELYIVDEGGHFQGAVPLDRLLRSKRPVPISDLMEKDRPRVSAAQDQEEVARLFQRYNWVTAPVVDANDRLVGVITFDDVADVLEEEAEEDIHALGGIPRHEELSDSVWTDRPRPFQLVAGQSRYRISGVIGAWSLRGSVAKNGGSRGFGADRCKPGRKCHNTDHDGRRASIGDTRSERRQRLARDFP